VCVFINIKKSKGGIMDKDSMNKQTRAIMFNALGRDFMLINIIATFSNLVTLTLISTENIAILPLSVGIVAALIFALIAGLNQIDSIKAHIMDMGKEEAESNMGKLAQNSPFSMWKTVYTLTYTIFALAQLYQIWL
jgi:hypothetical protein